MIQYQEFLQKKRHTTGNYKDRVSGVTVRPVNLAPTKVEMFA